MITREEFDRKYFTAKSQSAKNEACLEYINSLEAKLTNTEQLTCDGCKWYDELHPSYCDCLEPCKRFKHGWDKDRFEKDTQ